MFSEKVCLKVRHPNPNWNQNPGITDRHLFGKPWGDDIYTLIL